MLESFIFLEILKYVRKDLNDVWDFLLKISAKMEKRKKKGIEGNLDNFLTRVIQVHYFPSFFVSIWNSSSQRLSYTVFLYFDVNIYTYALVFGILFPKQNISCPF